MELYNFNTTYRVRAADFDYRGMVTPAAILNMYQDGRIAFLASLGGYTELNIGEHCGVIQREATIHILDEMSIGEEVAIGIKVERIKQASFQLGYRITREELILSEGTTQLAAYDYAVHKPRRLPEDFKRALTVAEEQDTPY